ncbi:hypothetical protein MHYP_G00131800 [Metynnis hypsauchen]
MDGQNEDAGQSSSPKVVSHGFMRVLNRPAQWLIIIALLVSWSAAGIFMFDFVSDTQMTNLQDIGSDPMTAVNKAVEGIADRMSHMNDIFSDAQGNEGVTGVFKLGTGALDEVNDWVRAPVGYLFHMFEDTLNVVIVQPLEIVGEGATFISDVAVAISNSVSGLFKGIGAWIPAMSTSPMDLANNVLEGAGNLKSTVFTTVSNLFAGDEGGIPDINFDPMKVVTDTVEEFADRRDMFLAYLSNILMQDKEEAPHVIRRKVAEVLGRKLDDAHIAMRTKLTKVAIAKQEVKDVDPTDEEAQAKNLYQVESLDMTEDTKETGEDTIDVRDEGEATGTGEDVSKVINEGTDSPDVTSDEATAETVEDISGTMGEMDVELFDMTLDDDTVGTVSVSDVLEEEPAADAARENTVEDPNMGDLCSEAAVKQELIDLMAEAVDISAVVDDVEEPMKSSETSTGSTDEDQTETRACPEAILEQVTIGHDGAEIKNDTEIEHVVEGEEEEQRANDEEAEEAKEKSETNEGIKQDSDGDAGETEADADEEEHVVFALGDDDNLDIIGSCDENNNNNENKRRTMKRDVRREAMAKAENANLPKETDDQEESPPEESAKGIIFIGDGLEK